MGGLKSAFKSIKRFVKKNTRDIATVIGFALFGVPGAAIGQGIGSLGEGRDLGDSIKSSLKVYAGASMAQGAGLQGGQGISSLNPMGKNFMFSPGNIGAGGVDPNAGRFGQFFQDVGATGRDLVSDPFGNSKTYKPVGSGDLGQSFKDMNFLQKGLTTAVGLDALGFDEMDDEEPATMPGPIDQSGYLQQGLTPATLSDVYNTGGTQTGIAGSMPSLAQNYDYDPINSSIAELLKQQDEYELEFPEFARVGMNMGGVSKPTVARLADGGTIPEIDLRDEGGDIVDENGSGDEDTVPALLADGEFVVTKQAVAGMGNGDHDQGIAQLYAMMDMNENKAQQMGIGRA